MIDFDKIWIDFECPKCGYINNVQLIDAKTEKIIFCHNCKSNIHLSDKEASVHSSINEANDLLKEFENTLKNFGK